MVQVGSIDGVTSELRPEESEAESHADSKYNPKLATFLLEGIARRLQQGEIEEREMRMMSLIDSGSQTVGILTLTLNEIESR